MRVSIPQWIKKLKMGSIMSYSPAFDGAVGAILVFFLVAGIIAFTVAVISETIVLHQLGWGSFLYSLLTSFLMNLASTIAGYYATFHTLLNRYFNMLSIGYYLIMFFLSILIEGAIMLRMRKPHNGLKDVWLIAADANIVSYVLLGIGFYLLFFAR
jgi:hypothetical protein